LGRGWGGRAGGRAKRCEAKRAIKLPNCRAQRKAEQLTNELRQNRLAPRRGPRRDGATFEPHKR